MTAPSPNILETIVAQKRREVAELSAEKVTVARMQQALQQLGPRRDFAGALRPRPGRPVTLIAEVKKASPSAGIICPNFDPVRIAREYEAAGADCLSVLTDREFFQGSLEYLARIRNAVDIPLLRKDFIIDERQILEAMQRGADAILLIVAILTDDQLGSYQELARAGGLAALVEVHDLGELERALASGASLVGVNNRDLKTFRVDLGTTERVASRLRDCPDAATRTLVAESGIHDGKQVERLRAAGACAILVGESLMRGGNIASKVRELLGEPAPDRAGMGDGTVG